MKLLLHICTTYPLYTQTSQQINSTFIQWTNSTTYQLIINLLPTSTSSTLKTSKKGFWTRLKKKHYEAIFDKNMSA